MRNFRFVLSILALMSFSIASAGSLTGVGGSERSLSVQIGNMLEKSNLIVEEEFTVKILFRLDEAGEIQIHSIDSPNAKVNEFLRRRLEGRNLKGEAWAKSKYYELPVKVEAQW